MMPIAPASIPSQPNQNRMSKAHRVRTQLWGREMVIRHSNNNIKRNFEMGHLKITLKSNHDLPRGASHLNEFIFRQPGEFALLVFWYRQRNHAIFLSHGRRAGISVPCISTGHGLLLLVHFIQLHVFQVHFSTHFGRFVCSPDRLQAKCQRRQRMVVLMRNCSS